MVKTNSLKGVNLKSIVDGMFIKESVYQLPSRDLIKKCHVLSKFPVYLLL